MCTLTIDFFSISCYNNIIKIRKVAGNMAKRIVKSRLWTMVVYCPDGMAFDEWKSKILDELTGNPFPYDFVISPLHDKDVNEDGTPKKAHYHVVFSTGYSNQRSINTALDLLRLHCPTLVECYKDCATPNFINKVISDLPSLVAYFIHEGCENKAQYSKDDYFYVNVDIEGLLAKKRLIGTKRGKCSVKKAMKLVTEYIQLNCTWDLYTLVTSILEDSELDDVEADVMLDFIAGHAYLVVQFIKSKIGDNNDKC